MEETLIRVVVADDHPVLRLGVETTLDDIPTIRHVGSAKNSTDLVALLDKEPCDVLVTDYAMPGGQYGDGMKLLAFLRDRYPALAIVVVTGVDKPAMVLALLERGVEQLVSKSDDMTHVVAAVQAALVRRRCLSPAIAEMVKDQSLHRSPPALSPREREVLSLYLGGASVNQIAEKLQRTKQTVSTQKVSGLAKLGIKQEGDLFKHAAELGLMAMPLDG